MKVALGIECEGTAHLIELHDDGTAVMLDHSEKTLRSFAAFDAPMPECLWAIERLRKDPISFLLTTDVLSYETQGLLGCDFVERVIGLVVQYMHYSGRQWNLETQALETAREVFTGLQSPTEARFLSGLVARRADYLSAEAGTRRAAKGIPRAADALEAILIAARTPDASSYTRSAIEMAAYRAAEVAFVGITLDATDEQRVAAEKRERKWQLRHAVRVLAALRDEKPWPKVEPIEVES